MSYLGFTMFLSNYYDIFSKCHIKEILKHPFNSIIPFAQQPLSLLNFLKEKMLLTPWSLLTQKVMVEVSPTSSSACYDLHNTAFHADLTSSPIPPVTVDYEGLD